MRYEPGEMVAPANLSRSGVEARSYHIAWDGNMGKSGKAYLNAVALRVFDRSKYDAPNKIQRYGFRVVVRLPAD